jgi:hypothetical protein
MRDRQTLAKRIAVAITALIALCTSAAHPVEPALPHDDFGYSENLVKLCQNAKKASAYSEFEFVINDRYCTIYVYSPIIGDLCKSSIDECAESHIKNVFNVIKLMPISNFKNCKNGECKFYFNFRDQDNRYESGTQCGFDIGGIAALDHQGRIHTLTSISISKNCTNRE